jgi:hypothetical protein
MHHRGRAWGLARIPNWPDAEVFKEGSPGLPAPACLHDQAGMEEPSMKTRSACLALALAGTALWSPLSGAQGNPGVVPIDARITTNKTYAELGAEWWQWAVQAPAADSPVLDTDGAKCRVGQQGPVWFLAGILGGGDANTPLIRACEMPPGKAIFFPVINSFYAAFLDDPPETRTEEFIREAAAGENAAVGGCDLGSIRDLSVKVDGRAVARPQRFVTTADESPLFQIQLPTDNIFGAVAVAPPPSDPPDPPLVIKDLLLSPMAHQGLYIYLRPLRPGKHTIEWTATWTCNFGDGPTPFTENIRYNLTVLDTVPGLVEK